MTVNRIIHHLFDQPDLRHVDQTAIEQLVEQYPYFTGAHLLLAKKLYSGTHDLTAPALQKAQLYCNAPQHLYELLQEDVQEPVADVEDEWGDDAVVDELITTERRTDVEEEEEEEEDELHISIVLEDDETDTEGGVIMAGNPDIDVDDEESESDVLQAEQDVELEISSIQEEDSLETESSFIMTVNPDIDVEEDEETGLDIDMDKKDEEISLDIDIDRVDEEISSNIDIDEKDEETGSDAEIEEEALKAALENEINDAIPASEILTPTPENDEGAPIRIQPMDTPSGETTLTFQPLYTEDYFAYKKLKDPNTAETMTEQAQNEMKSFTDWLRQLKDSFADQTSRSWYQQQMHKLYDDEEPEVSETVEKMAISSITLNDDIVSETLAEIWIRQHQPEKAIHVYQKLSLLNPDKNAYFAQKIKELQLLTDNNK